MPGISYNKVVRRRETMFKTCCFCIPNRVGCFILAYLTLRRLRPIRVYLVFFSIAFLIMLAECIYNVMHMTETRTIICAKIIDLVLNVYFFLVFYNYAVQLEIDLEEAEERNGLLNEA